MTRPATQQREHRASHPVRVATQVAIFFAEFLTAYAIDIERIACRSELPRRVLTKSCRLFYG